MESVVIPYGILQHFFPENKKELMRQPLICHLAGSDANTRIQHSIDYYMNHYDNINVFCGENV